MSEDVFGAFLCVVITLWIWGAISVAGATRILETVHPNEWKDLGCPRFSFLQSATVSWRFSLFVIRGSHRALNDPKLNEKCLAIKLCMSLMLVCFVLAPII